MHNVGQCPILTAKILKNDIVEVINEPIKNYWQLNNSSDCLKRGGWYRAMPTLIAVLLLSKHFVHGR